MVEVQLYAAKGQVDQFLGSSVYDGDADASEAHPHIRSTDAQCLPRRCLAPRSTETARDQRPTAPPSSSSPTPCCCCCCCCCCCNCCDCDCASGDGDDLLLEEASGGAMQRRRHRCR